MSDLEEDQPSSLSPEDLPDNAADKKSVARKKAESGRRDKRLQATLVGILSIKDGREWIWALLESCNVFSQSFVQGEPESTAFNEGKRSVGNRLLAEITSGAPEAFVQMMKESKQYNG